ncbi:hypothetical protein [Pedobacter sp. WC2423]|uniref:hypothetical protein n=1 Tax=Pedobacter sp. WC2423 TaxID=3234142 RepID=UPI0034679ABE
MKIEDIKGRINELISFGAEVMKTQKDGGQYGLPSVNVSMFNELRSASLSFLKTIFEERHPFYKEFDAKTNKNNPTELLAGIGILKAAKQEIDGGWLFTVKGLVSAEIFSDFLEMADYLLQEGYKDPAAVMTGSVLEEHLRQLCNRAEISVEVEKGGKLSPKKADLLNADLANAEAYNKLDQKAITTWLDLRNKAAHGKYTEYTKEQVEMMYQGVANFISRTT